jgi:hypothetical protein
MSESYEIDSYEVMDRTSTNPYYDPSSQPMPSEEEGLRMAAERSTQMFNPLETLYGVGHMASGAANDLARLAGAEPPSRNPSLVNDLGHLGTSLKENPLGTAADMVMAPGSIPGMFTGRVPFALRTPLNRRVLNQATRQAKKHGGYVDDAAINSKFRNSQELWKGGLKIDKDKNVVLQRWADDQLHMTKDWQPANQASLKDTSRVTGGGGGLPTSVADAGFGTGARKTMGEFKIPAKEFPKAFKDKNAIFGNIGEGEMVLNPAWAKQYYRPVKSKWSPPPKNLTPEPPGAIYLD